MFRLFGHVMHIGLWVLSCVGTSLLAITLMFYATGLRPIVITSGSMTPSIPAGSLVIARETPSEDVEIGDVVTVSASPTKRVTHRVVGIDGDDTRRQLWLQGDANENPDELPVTAPMVHRTETIVPQIGFALVKLRSPSATAVSGALIGVIGLIIAGRMRTRLGRGATSSSAADIGTEIRMPLTSIVGYSEMLGDGSIGKLEPGQQKAVEAMQRSAHTLSELVDSLK